MPRSLNLHLTDEQRRELTWARDRHPKPYVREKAAALLKIADRQTAKQVAQQGLLRTRQSRTVRLWVKRYLQQGLPGLVVAPGRGRRQRFEPEHGQSVREALLRIVGSAPGQHGLRCTRWSLRALAQVHPQLGAYSVSGLWRLLRRHGVHYKRGRQYVHSPDTEYAQKVETICLCFRSCVHIQRDWALVFLDEMSYYRCPEVGWDYAAAGKEQPLAPLGYSSNRCYRVLATLDGMSGRVVYWEGKQVSRSVLVAFFQRFRQEYAQFERIWVVLDNWPVHYHAQVLEALEPQRYLKREYLHLPASWELGSLGSEEGLCLPIQLLAIPTYAPWWNPVEKLWRWLRQEVLRQHRFGDAVRDLRAAVRSFLDQFSEGSESLLRYVGLRSADGLYSSVFSQEVLLG